MSSDEKDAVRVTLNVYSGMPDPSWVLSERQVEELKRLLEASMEQQPAEPVTPPYLGYTGFAITNPGRLSGISYKVKVYGGAVTVTVKDEKKNYEDAGRTTSYRDTYRLESWLLEQATERGYERTIENMGGRPRKPKQGQDR